MKKITIVLLLVSLSFIYSTAAIANEIDDQNVAELFSAAQKIRSYGDDCWEVLFEKNWTLPDWSPFDDKADFRFYAMDLEVLRRPSGDYNYQTFTKQFARSTKKTFAPGERALIVCLPQDMKFDDYKTHLFRPWVVQEIQGRSREWTFIKLGSKWLAKQTWLVEHTWYAGTRSIQDFACTGKGDKNIAAITRDSITFTPRTEICFQEDHYKENNPYLHMWKDADGNPVAGKSFEPGKEITLKIDPPAKPKGWEDLH